MANCFVIQPFDQGGPYDKRYHDVLVPAIEAAGLTPYRVDEDLGTTIIIENIENGIRESEICLADITTNNPNIWYEVGFALATNKPVVLICLDPRPEPFPFDIKHRFVIIYKLHSSSDFDKLKSEITARLTAQAKKAEALQTVAAMSEMRTESGLSSHEIAVLVTLMSERSSPNEGIAPFQIKNKTFHSGYTELAVSLALESLSRKGMIEYYDEQNFNSEMFTACRLTGKGLDWLLAHQNSFRLRKNEALKLNSSPITDEDIPF